MKVLKITLLSLFFIFFISCSNETADEKTADLYYKIDNLQVKQQKCIDDYNPRIGNFDEQLMRQLWSQVLNEVSYTSDENADYWSTSCETEVTWQGDCEDIAVYATHLLRSNGFGDGQIGMIIASHPEHQDLHVFAAAFPNGRDADYWVMDKSSKIQKASWMFGAVVGWTPEIGFNFFETWDYNDQS